MKIYYVLLIMVILAGCATQNVEEGLVSFPDDVTGDVVFPVDDVTTTLLEVSTTETQDTIEATTTEEVATTVEVTTTKVTSTTQELQGSDITVITINEGDLLKLNLKATDPD